MQRAHKEFVLIYTIQNHFAWRRYLPVLATHLSLWLLFVTICICFLPFVPIRSQLTLTDSNWSLNSPLPIPHPTPQPHVPGGGGSRGVGGVGWGIGRGEFKLQLKCLCKLGGVGVGAFLFLPNSIGRPPVY
jgi:hypothetical protein